MSWKQKITGKSGTEIKIVGVGNSLPQVSQMNCFTEAQGWTMSTIVHQDNKSAIPLENNGQLSRGSSHTKHINVQHCFVMECIDWNEFSIRHLGTEKCGQIFT